MTKKLYAQRIDPKIRDDFIKTLKNQTNQIEVFMNENEEVARKFVEDKFAFQVREWKNGIVFVNFCGGYKKDPQNDTFFGNTIAMIQNGKISMKIYENGNMRARSLMKMVAEKFGLEIVD